MAPDTARRRLLKATAAALTTPTIAGCGMLVEDAPRPSGWSADWQTTVTSGGPDTNVEHDYHGSTTYAIASGYVTNRTDQTYSTVKVHVAFYDRPDLGGERLDVVETDAAYDIQPDQRANFRVDSGPYDQEGQTPMSAAVKHIDY